ncbi:MAG TPA: sigma-70 family RNA polymerase sigma factor [Candidatus Polarisedimenticolaceae bacterium]|nr:sigma-70 family RNA polymerase sigma factor [Candidatus Polarisedimenticolaceae bacterium]
MASFRPMSDPGVLRDAAADEDADLVARAKGGDRRAFDILVERHLPRVWRVVYRVLRQREDTEDVVQEVFLTAHRSLREFRGDAKLSTWLHRIAVTRALNHADRAAEKVRRASEPIEAAGEPSSPSPTPLHALEAKELRRRLADCLEKVPEAWRAVLALRDAEQMAYEEIASVLGLAIGTVRSRLARARQLLQQCVEAAS